MDTQKYGLLQCMAFASCGKVIGKCRYPLLAQTSTFKYYQDNPKNWGSMDQPHLVPFIMSIILQDTDTETSCYGRQVMKTLQCQFRSKKAHLWGHQISLGVFWLICLQFDPKFSKFPWNMGWKVWLFALEKVWIMGFCRVMGFWAFLVRTMLVEAKMYGVSQVMGYDPYGLWQWWL